MAIFDKIFKSATDSTITAVGDAVDNLFTNDEERQEKKNELSKIITDYGASLANAQKDVLITELTGSKLQRNWRPVLMLAFGFIICYEYFFSSIFNLPKSNLPSQFWDLLSIGMGGYIIGRSAETIVKSVTENMDKIPRKK